MRVIPVFFSILTLSMSVAGAGQASLPRHPAPSPDGLAIAFSWQGDLWLVPTGGGEASRLTVHPAADRHPVWSRDGKWIAFASDRYGNDDVYALRADGSEAPTRLTFASAADTPVDFTPEGDRVLFVSRRAESLRWMNGLYTVPLSGGTPSLAQSALGHWAAYSPDGSNLAYVRGATKGARQRYRGEASRDLWLRTDDGDDVRLTTFAGDDDHPSWVDGHTLAFLSSRTGRKEIHLLDLVTGTAQPLTTHGATGVRFPRASADGTIIAYEFEDTIRVLDVATGTAESLHITVPADRIANPVERLSTGSDADELAVSPDGKLAAVVVHGDIFVTAITSKEDQEIAPPPTVRVTATAAREKDISWAPDGSALLFTSDRAGNEDLFLARPEQDDTPWVEGFQFPVETLVDSPAEEHSAHFSPDGKRIAYVRGKGTLVVRNIEGGAERVLLEHWEQPDYRWSPDGAWIAYSTPDSEYNHDLWIVPVEGGEAYNVSRHPDDDGEPSWSPDGRRLLWVSRRHADTFDVWSVWLTRADHERTAEGWLKLWRDEKDGDKDKKKEEGEEAAEDEDETADLPAVVVELDGLWERVLSVTDLKGDESTPLAAPDGKKIVFSAEHEGETDLYVVRWDGEELTRLTSGGEAPSAVQITADDSTLFYLSKNGSVKRTDLDGKGGDPVPFSARMEIDRQERRAQVFDEAWRQLRTWFYDPAFHGVDWQAQRELYRPWALRASHDRDFADVLNLMLGELNASHMGYYPKRSEGGETTGWIGAVFDPTAGGPGLLVSEVLRDSPAARVDVGLAAGERLLAVNGTEITPGTNIFALFAETVGRKTPMRVLGDDGEKRSIVVEPVGGRAVSQLRYASWVRQRRAIVEHLSGGRLGYLHIQGMDIPSFEEFERDLYAAGHGKEALVIDVRSNGGGWTTDYLMAVLGVRRHAFTVPRDEDPEVRAYPQGRLPLAAWTRPAAVLCNEESYSNAEIFSHAFKSLDRGVLVGVPTFGAVISTGGMSLLDGGWVRLPLRGWYVAESGVNMENNGAVPDVEIRQPPSQDTMADEDAQLERAVEELMSRMEDDPRRGAW